MTEQATPDTLTADVAIELPSPFSAAETACPFAAYADLRQQPVRRIDIRPGLSPWLVTRMEDVRRMLTDPRLSTNPEWTTEEVRAAISLGRAEERSALLGANLSTVNQPEHTSLRRVMSGALSARRMAQVEGAIGELTDRVLGGFQPGQRVDLLLDITLPLAVDVICTLIGIPAEDHHRFHDWGRSMVGADLEDAAAFDAATKEMAGYLIPFIFSRVAAGGDDLVGALAAARKEGQIDDRQLIALVFQLFFAGHETSAYFMASAMLLLLSHPDQLARLRAEESLLEPAVEEMLRLEGPIKSPTWRFAREEVTIGSAVVRPGEPVLALLAAAGRDEAQHSDPEEFRIDRSDSSHLAFGYGIHHCMGAALARVEARVFLRAMLARFPQLRLATEPDALRWRVSLMVRGVRSLPVTL